jgi:hypothetical protein
LSGWKDESAPFPRFFSCRVHELRMCRVQVQILLYMLKLSLPGPPPSNPARKHDSPASSPKKRRNAKLQVATPSVEDRLESFMDKLSMWQLIGGLEERKEEAAPRDWMQTFCETVVEPEYVLISHHRITSPPTSDGLLFPRFRSKLPEQCALLRSKVFPDSPGSGDDSRASSRSTSPTNDLHHRSRKGRAAPPRVRARSRSLSVSLAQEADDARRRAGNARLISQNTRVFSREVSMSRTFRANPDKGKGKAPGPAKALAPARKGASKSDAGPQMLARAAERGVTLVVATPVKKIKNVSAPPGGGGRKSDASTASRASEGEEEIWEIPSSPNISWLDEARSGSLPEGEGPRVAVAKKTKKKGKVR